MMHSLHSLLVRKFAYAQNPIGKGRSTCGILLPVNVAKNSRG